MRLLIFFNLLVSASGFSQTYFQEGPFRYEVISEENQTVRIIEYNEWGISSVTIPSSVNFSGNIYTVTAIGDHAFMWADLQNVIIPQTVTSIGNSAFEGNQLTSINLPDNLTSIGYFAFFDSRLTNITLPASLTNIGWGAFDMNWDLRSVTSLSLTPGQNPFMDSYNIDLTIPSGTAAAYAAAGWTGFRSITEVNMASSEITEVTFEGDTFTYDGTAHSIAVTGLPEGATVKYADNGQINAGTYKVTATVSQDNYNDKVLTASLVIEKAEAVITADAVQTFTYDGDVKNV
ncbi:leucine-rich repeat protein, partial [Autumnicola psychrophila]